MKWDKKALLAVIVIFSLSYLYSSFKGMQLSSKIEEEKRNACIGQGRHDCELITKYHDDCFASSYRAEYRIRTLHHLEYDECISEKIAQDKSETGK